MPSKYLNHLTLDSYAWTSNPLILLGVVAAAIVLFIPIYNLYFHPLAKFPGPLLARSTLLWRFLHTATGRVHLSIEKLHRRYGAIVRISPNELSFGSVESWRPIYGHAAPGRPVPIKAPFYEVYGAGFRKLCIGSERNPQKHAEMRKQLSMAFSQRALYDQEELVTETVDRFIDAVGRLGTKSEGLNMTKWYEIVAFDILGEMAFGESFGSIEKGAPHPWSDLVEEHLYLITLIDNLGRIPFVSTIAKIIFPSALVVQNQNSVFTRKQVEKRLGSSKTRKDFLTLLVQKVRDGEVEKEQMAAHVSTLAIAGGETVSTFLAATTNFLLREPVKMQKLVDEIRQAFPSYESITAQQAQQLPYLQAVISEGLRLYPPGSQGFPRVSPGFELHGQTIPQGAEVYTSAWTVTHDPQYFSDPMAFKPERWLEKMPQEIKEASQPFSLGPRSCLGRNFAYMEMNLIISKLLWKFDLELVNPEMNWLDESKVFVMWWKPTLKVRFHDRQSTSKLS